MNLGFVSDSKYFQSMVLLKTGCITGLIAWVKPILEFVVPCNLLYSSLCDPSFRLLFLSTDRATGLRECYIWHAHFCFHPHSSLFQVPLSLPCQNKISTNIQILLRQLATH